jgi:hypothetical protein
VLRAKAVLGLTRVCPTRNLGELITLLEQAICELDGDRELTLELEAARLTLAQTSRSSNERRLALTVLSATRRPVGSTAPTVCDCLWVSSYTQMLWTAMKKKAAYLPG